MIDPLQQRRLALWRRVSPSLLGLTLLLTACATQPYSPLRSASLYSRPELKGTVHGGQQPIVGANIQLYAAGTTGDQSAAISLLASPVLTDASGAFSVDDVICPAPNSRVYVTSTGGNPGLAQGQTNGAAALMASLGPCDNLSSLNVSVNEVTTVGSINAIQQFMASAQNVGSSPSNIVTLNADFSLTKQLVNIWTGTSPGTQVPPGYAAPTAAIYTLANATAACVNSAGGIAGDGSNCGKLFQYATPPNGSAPTNTIDALLDIAKNPNHDVESIFDLALPDSPFQPTLAQAPSDWAIAIGFVSAPSALPRRADLLGEYLLQEGSGMTAHDSSGQGNDATISGATWDGTQDLNLSAPGQYLQLPTASNSAQSWQFAIFNPPFGNSSLPQTPGDGFPGAYYPSLLCGTDTGHLCFAPTSLYQPRAMRFFAFNTDGTEANAALPSGWHVVTYLCGSNVNGVVTKTRILYDGAEVSGYIQQGDAGTCPAPASGNYQVGGSNQYGPYWFQGKIAAVWAWRSQLSLEEGQAAAQYAFSIIQGKGIQTIYPDVVNTYPTIIGGLDSRTVGVGNTPQTVWLQEMQLTDSSYKRVNLGIPGQLAFDACMQFDATYSEQIGESANPVITILWGGVNDYGIPVEDIASALQCMVEKAKAAGSRVVLATELGAAANLTSYYDQYKDMLDPIIRANGFSWGADNIADLATDSLIGADGASANTSCFPDNLHPGPNCEPHITAIMQNAVNELLGSTPQTHHSTTDASYAEQAGDRYLDLFGTGQAVTLPSCIGYSLPRYVINYGTTVATLSPITGEAFSGNTNVAPGATATLSSVPGSAAASGCTWTRTN